ncbi:nuclear transport factor 2 family protein [Mycolicibacterium neoaurum]|uniref:nuclear transport factor 2 family protein n=1 Tax=Mycolicibacterium neoaurum TaxID=1795 RepID=UPI00248BD875|nr:nuclear transport factor 2 family protein [Mycolicibacterium neoaurum]MDO3401255.1 nuclear transport factor 2 family protein [Mycolicibacterium neoaurum]WBP94029.1 nuclear transport factor 2 family protein [Mycolicibacterium neoaurum]WBS07167.1 nuclear transport factor 2 family protein [Mycolicibacterium neoaurum]
MTTPSTGDPAPTGYTPSPADVAGVVAWFEHFDALAVTKDVEAMADQAMFPLNEVSDGKAESYDRARYVAQMTSELGGSEQVDMVSVRTPTFLNENLVFVVTDATITMGDTSQQVRYGDLLVKCAGTWKFQTMVQGGWTDF